MTLQSCTPDLVAAAREDPAAFAMIYRCYVKGIYRYIFHRVNNAHDAEDLTAQVFVAAWESLPNYQERGFFTAWLFSIARHKVRDFQRKHKIDLPLESPQEKTTNNPDPLLQIEIEETLSHLKGMIAGLPSEQQELLRLRFAGGLTYRQIGALTGKSEAAIKMSISRLLDQLRAEWKE